MSRIPGVSENAQHKRRPSLGAWYNIGNMSDDTTSIEQTAARIRKARLAQKLTQVEVAKSAGISENHYAQIERAEKNPTTSTFKSIIRAIGVSSEEVLGS